MNKSRKSKNNLNDLFEIKSEVGIKEEPVELLEECRYHENDLNSDTLKQEVVESEIPDFPRQLQIFNEEPVNINIDNEENFTGNNFTPESRIIEWLPIKSEYNKTENENGKDKIDDNLENNCTSESRIVEWLPIKSEHNKTSENGEDEIDDNTGFAMHKVGISNHNFCKNESNIFQGLEASVFTKRLSTVDIPFLRFEASFPKVFSEIPPKLEERESNEMGCRSTSYAWLADTSMKTFEDERENSSRDNADEKSDKEDINEIEVNFLQEKNDFENTLYCSLCGYKAKTNSLFKKHLLFHAEKKLLKCPECDYECNRKDRLNCHLLTHSNLKLFKCPECDYECNQKGSLKLHLLTHSNTKLFKCSECDYDCNLKCSLKLHLLTHSDSKLFKCSECDYKCNYKSSLKLHLLTHSTTKLLKCTECDYECIHKGSLKYHLLTHSNNTKLFKCSECDYESNRKESLKRHSLIHAKTKLFKCPECDYECNQKCHLKRHALTHSNTKLFKCSDCDYECNQKCRLKVHSLRHLARGPQGLDLGKEVEDWNPQ